MQKQQSRLTPLQNSIIENNFDKFNELIQNGEDIRQVDSKGKTLLHLACENGSVNVSTTVVKPSQNRRSNQITTTSRRGEGPGYIAKHRAIVQIINILLKHGADVNAKDNQGNTPLHLACVKRLTEPEVIKLRVSAIELLICNGADVNASGFQSQTPLHLACNLSIEYSIKDNIMARDIIKLLTDNGADVTAKDDKGRTPLHIVCSTGNSEKGRMEIIEILINRGADINGVDSKGRNILYYVSEKFRRYMDDQEWTDLAATLIDFGANVTIADKKGNTLLHLNPELRIAEKLVQSGADINAKNRKGETVLVGMAKERGLSELKFLIENGADLSTKSNDGDSVLHLVAKDINDRMEKILLVLDSGLNPNERNNMGRTPLYLVVGDPAAVQLLLSRGADPNIQDLSGCTPLHEAAKVSKTVTYMSSKKFETNGVESVKILSEQVENINCRTNEGSTALHEAMKSGIGMTDETLMKITILLSKGADPNLRDYKGRLPIYYAAFNNNLDVVKNLYQITEDARTDVEKGIADGKLRLKEEREKPFRHLGQGPTLSSDEESLEDLKQDVKAIALAPNPPPPPPPPPNPNT